MQTLVSSPSTQVVQLPSGNLMQAHRQWADRPEDERFDSLDALHAACVKHRDLAREKEVEIARLRFGEIGGDRGEVVVGQGQGDVGLSHYAFGQVARCLGAPAGYLRVLPAPLAADCLNAGVHQIARRDRESGESTKLSLLFRAGNGAPPSLRAALSSKYARIWDFEIAGRLRDFVASNPSWGFPESFRRANGVDGSKQTVAHAWGESKVLPVAFASDHDMFVFLADYERPIEVEGAVLARGFFVENSEVGAGALKITSFLFDFACSNVIVWNAKNVQQIKIRHIGEARDRALADFGEAQAHLRALAHASVSEEVAVISRAQKLLVADTKEEVVDKLYARRIPGLTQAAIEDAVLVAEQTPRHGDPRSVWAVVQGLTEVSQKEVHADARMELDRAAGRVLEMAF